MSLIEELIEAESSIPEYVARQWSQRTEERAVLLFPSGRPDGYDVEVHASNEAIIVYADVAHIEITEPPDPAGRVREALGLVQDLRSSRTRLRIRFAGGKPYRWTIEELEDGAWRRSFLTGLLFWNYLGRRTQVIRQNAWPPFQDPPTDE